MNKRLFSFEGFILSVVIVLANLRALMFFTLYPETGLVFGSAWIEIGFWILTGVSVGYLLVRNKLVVQYFSAWRVNWVLGVFIILAFISAFWSLDFSATLFRALELLFATLIASYFGMRYRPNQMMNVLFWFGAILVILSVALVIGAPPTGTMPWAPFYGAWRGVYWHRNHLSSIITLVNAVFLLRVITAVQHRLTTGILDGAFYLLSLVVILFAKSATGYILFILLHLFVICVWLWIKYSARLRAWHYGVVFGIFIAGSILILSNLEVVFGLLNRSPTLTGRTDLWSYLLKEIIPARPWLGHGFGAIWAREEFRIETQQQIGWGSPVLIADNGFLDILLHVGVAGLLVFISILVLAIIQSLRHGVSQRTLTGFLPLLIMFYAVIANISFSLFAETEVFVWFLLVAVLFMTTPQSDIPRNATTR